MTTHPRIFLRRGKEESLLRRHPWIFSGAIGRVECPSDTIAEGGDRRRPYRRRRFHRTRPLPDRIDRRAGAHLRAGADRRRMVARSHPLGLRSEAHARSDRQCRDDLLPARSRRGRLAAGAGDRHLRHDGRRTVSFGGDVPLADADRRGAPRGLRRASRSRYPTRRG